MTSIPPEAIEAAKRHVASCTEFGAIMFHNHTDECLVARALRDADKTHHSHGCAECGALEARAEMLQKELDECRAKQSEVK